MNEYDREWLVGYTAYAKGLYRWIQKEGLEETKELEKYLVQQYAKYTGVSNLTTGWQAARLDAFGL